VSKQLKLLILDDCLSEVELMEQELNKGGLAFSLKQVRNEEEFIAALRAIRPDLVLAEPSLPGFGGVQALAALRREHSAAPFIAVSRSLGEANIVELLHQGATDCISKDGLSRLVPAIQRALREVEQQAERRESESRFRAIFESASIGIAVEDLTGRIIESNEALQQMLGYESEELRQVTRRDFTHIQDHKEDTRYFHRLLSGDSPYYQAEKRFVRKDGRIIWGRLTVSLIRNAAGRPQFRLAMIEDITERQQAQETLLQYAAIVECSEDAIVSKTFDGIIFSWNPGAERLYGFSAREANGRPLSIIVPPDKETESSRMLERMRRGERVETFETTRLRKDGVLIDVSVTTSPIKDASGKLIGAVSIARDITGRKRAETRFATFSNLGLRLSSATTAGEAAAIIVEVADRLLGWDSCSLDLCSPDQKIFNSVLGRDVINGQRMDVPPTYRHARPSPQLRRILEKGAELILRPEPVSSPEFIPFGDTSRASASLMYVPVRNGPKIVGVLSIQSYSRNAYTADDLNTLQALADHCGGALERIRAEAENQKLAAFPQFNPNPVLELLNDGSLHYFNDAALQMAKSLGREYPSEILPTATAAIVRECLATGQSRLRHETVIEGRTISWSYFPVQAIGIVHCYAGDITDRQNLEAQLRQSQKMESIGQLAGGIAHDFNNILTVIQGHTSLLSMVPGLPQMAGESAQQIAFAAERAANLTRQLLTFSRRQIMQPKRLDLNEVVGNMTRMLRRLLGEDITLQVDCAPKLPLIQADPGMMEQILLNLAVNARDAMPKGGQLFVSTSLVTIDDAYVRQTAEARTGPHVCLTVKDTGAGIAPENLPRIFEPFFTTKDVGKGTGLGLATVYGIVRQHRGWVKASSRLEQETTFETFLPALAAGAESPEPRPPETNIRGGKETLLVVEDEPPLRGLVRTVLERYGYTVLDAPCGADAIPIWREHKERIQLLLTDMVMPHGISGRELAEQFLREKPQLKVIYSSGYSLEVVGVDMVLREGLNFLQKPYHPRKLARAVRDCLDSVQPAAIEPAG
jgi:PAS domain S-box-containing protein